MSNQQRNNESPLEREARAGFYYDSIEDLQNLGYGIIIYSKGEFYDKEKKPI
jgi:hypothetical protein